MMFHWPSLVVLLVCFLSVGARTKGGHHKLKFYRQTALRNLTLQMFDSEGIRREAAPFMKIRMPDTDGIRKVQKHIVDKLTKLDWDVELDAFEDNTPFDRKNFTNIIATYDPLAPYKLVLACHYDSKNMTYETKEKTDFIGAIDSAVPCAVMMDLAVQFDCFLRKTKSIPDKEITLQFIFFDGEEAYYNWNEQDSLYGSRHLANRWSIENDQNLADQKKIKSMKLLVLLDLIGTRNMHFKDFQMDSSYYFQKLIKIEKMLKKGLLNLAGLNKNGRIFTDSIGWGVQDDHIPFLTRDVPVLHLIPTPFPEVWHTFEDNENAVDYDVTENFIKILQVFVAGYLHLDLKGGCKNK